MRLARTSSRYPKPRGIRRSRSSLGTFHESSVLVDDEALPTSGALQRAAERPDAILCLPRAHLDEHVLRDGVPFLQATGVRRLERRLAHRGIRRGNDIKSVARSARNSDTKRNWQARRGQVRLRHTVAKTVAGWFE